MGNTARNSNYFLLRLPLMISLISQYLDVFSCAYTERPIVSYGLGWDSGVFFNFSKHRLTYSNIDTPYKYPGVSLILCRTLYYYYYSANYPCGRRFCLFFSVSVGLVIMTMFLCVPELFSVIRLHFLVSGSVHCSVTCQIIAPVRFKISMSICKI